MKYVLLFLIGLPFFKSQEVDTHRLSIRFAGIPQELNLVCEDNGSISGKLVIRLHTYKSKKEHIKTYVLDTIQAREIYNEIIRIGILELKDYSWLKDSRSPLYLHAADLEIEVQIGDQSYLAKLNGIIPQKNSTEDEKIEERKIAKDIVNYIYKELDNYNLFYNYFKQLDEEVCYWPNGVTITCNNTTK